MALDAVRLRATYSTVEWEDGSEDPIETGGFTSVSNPWGGFRSEMPEKAPGEGWAAWEIENVDTVTVDAWTAAEMVQYLSGLQQTMTVPVNLQGYDKTWRNP